MAEKTTTEDRYIALPDGAFSHVIHDPSIRVEVVEKMEDGAWYPMGMFHTLENRDAAHRLAERHMQITGRDVRVVAVLSVDEYAGELERRAREAAKTAGTATAPAKTPKKFTVWAQTPDGTWVKRTTANPYTAALAVKWRDEEDWFIPTFSRTAANAAAAGRQYSKRGHSVRVVPVISDDAMRAVLAAEVPAEPAPAEVEESAARDAAAKTVALRASKNATTAVIPAPAPAAEVEDTRRIKMDQFDATTGRGYVYRTDAPDAEALVIYAERRGRRWTVGTDWKGDALEGASGSTLAVAIKRWARGHGIAKGSATIAHSITGRTRTAAWDGWRNR